MLQEDCNHAAGAVSGLLSAARFGPRPPATCRTEPCFPGMVVIWGRRGGDTGGITGTQLKQRCYHVRKRLNSLALSQKYYKMSFSVTALGLLCVLNHFKRPDRGCYGENISGWHAAQNHLPSALL